MKPRNFALAIAAGATLFAAAPAFAQQPYYAPAYGYGYGYRHHRHYYRPRPVVVYEPAPYYYYPPAPAYYHEPRPVIYGRVPIGDARIGFRIGL